MARTIPGSGAVIKPIFNEVYGVKAVKVLNGGEGYTSEDPPKLTITGCGTPVEEALLYPIIDDDSGKIVHVRVLQSGLGYDPLRLSILPTQDTPNVVDSFNINRIWQSNLNSVTRGEYETLDGELTDRLTITSDNHPKPADIPGERNPGGGDLIDRNYNHSLIYRGGKDVPTLEDRPTQTDKAVGIMANGVLLHTPEWGVDGNAPINFNIDTVKYSYVKSNDEFDGVVENGIYYYQSPKLIDHFSRRNSVFENGFLRQFVWDVKVELNNILVIPTDINQLQGNIEEGRNLVSVVGTKTAQIAKVIRNGNQITKIYLRNVSGTFEDGDTVLGSNGFNFTISGNPVTFPNGIFYINFRNEAPEFGNFQPNTWYLAPQNIRVPRNYLIVWNQADASNVGHQMQFSTTQDGLLNGGQLYLNTNENPPAPAADYEDEYKAHFIMNSGETRRIYYHCKNHRHMSGYIGDEGYIELSNVVDNNPLPNNYFVTNNFSDGNTVDFSRHTNGHSKILGVSFDGYPIYGPYGYNSSGNVARMQSSYRLKVGDEIVGTRPKITTTGTVTYTVTVSNGKYFIDGNETSFLGLDRGKTYIFNLDDTSNNAYFLLFSEQEDGWHSDTIGNLDYVYSDGVSYYIGGSEVDYDTYIESFGAASQRQVRITPRVDSPRLLYIFSYVLPGYGFRTVQDGYLLGDLVQDYIYDELVGDLDAHNGKFAVTPEYPNGTYAYFMSTDSNNNPVYPYVIGPEFYGNPVFEGNELPSAPVEFPSGASGDIVLNEDGSINYVKITRSGDGYFAPTQAKILGGGGTGAVVSPIVQTITGLALLNPGRNFETPPTIIFEGGGNGQGARGAAEIDTSGKVTRIDIVDPGEFYETPPYILLTGGGGSGARAVARIDQGEIVGIDVIEEGRGYINPPSVIFTKLINLKRRVNARQSYNSTPTFLTGLLKSLSSNDDSIYVDSTDAFPGSGELLINNEIIRYASKSRERFTGVTRGINFNYDQRVILDDTQNDQNGVSTYDFNVGDRVIRRVESSSSKVAKVYDWNPINRELLVTFEVDELAFIDGGIPSTEDAIVQFDAGVAASAPAGFNPHQIIQAAGETITLLTVPLSTLNNSAFVDQNVEDPDNPGTFIGDGIPDLVNTDTEYADQISLDGGIYNSLYGIEETVGGQNTTLFQVGDSIKDASLPFKFATIVDAGQLSEGRPQEALIKIYIDGNFGNGQNYSVNEFVTGEVSGVGATVVSWDSVNGVLIVKDIVPFNTNNINVGVAGYLYKFSENSTIVDYIVQDPGSDYSAVPSVVIENTGDILASATAVMTSSGDQIESITVVNGGYGYRQYVDNTYNPHPTITIVNDPSDTTGSGAVVQAITGGERILGNGGASYRIKRIEYQTLIRSD
jgi:hypothetical protein